MEQKTQGGRLGADRGRAGEMGGEAGGGGGDAWHYSVLSAAGPAVTHWSPAAIFIKQLYDCAAHRQAM